MDLTLTPFTLIPIGSLMTIGGLVWYLSKKFTLLAELKEKSRETEKLLAEALRKAEFDKHVTEDLVFHNSILEKVSTQSIIQARTDEKLSNIEKSLVIIQADVKKVLEK